MKMLGEEQSVHRDLNSPEKFELEEKTFSTDYAYIRAGSRGKELTVSDKSDQYAKFFTVGAKQILMPDEDEDDLVWGWDFFSNLYGALESRVGWFTVFKIFFAEYC